MRFRNNEYNGNWHLEWPTDEETIEAIKSIPQHFALTNVASGATKRTALLNAVGQEATLWVGGQTKVGIGVYGVSGTITLSFEASYDGITYWPLSVGVYPATLNALMSGAGGGNLATTTVTSATANGNWEVNVPTGVPGAPQFVRVQQTAGTGSAKVVIAASVDGSYQEAFNPPTNAGVSTGILYPSTTSSGGVNTMAIPANANAAINLTFLDVEMSGPGFGAQAVLRIWDGAVNTNVPIFQGLLTGPVGSVSVQQVINLPKDEQGNVSLLGTPGNPMNIQIINLGSVFAVMNARYTYK